MSYKYVLTVTPGTQISQILQSAQTVQAVKITNGTPFDLDYFGLGATGLVVIPAGLEYMFYSSDHLDGKCTILPVNNNNVPGTGVVNINEYLQGEVLPQGTWPVTVPTQTVQAKVSTVTTLVNDGSALGTQIIESTPLGAASSTISVLNDGTVTIKGDVAAVLTALLQLIPGAAGGASSVKLSDSTRQTEVLGTLLVDGASTFTGDIAANGAGTGLNVANNETIGGTLAVTGDIAANGAGTGLAVANNETIGGTLISTGLITANGALQLGVGSSDKVISGDNTQTIIDCTSAQNMFFNPPKSGSGNKIAFATNGTERFAINDTGPIIENGATYQFLKGTISRQNGNGNTTCGSGTTITHSLGATPALVLATPNIAQPGSATVGIGSVGATTFQATVGAGSAISWWCLAG